MNWKIRTGLLLMTLSGLSSLGAQTEAPVDVCDLALTLTAGETKEFFYGFAAGDQLVLNFTDEKEKNEWQIEVTEFPEYIRLQEVEAGQIRGRRLPVNSTAVYRFRIVNPGKRDRSCRLQVQRIPSGPSTRSFITGVDWIEQRDTTVLNTTAHMERRQVQQKRRVQYAVDTNVVNLMDRTERIASRGNWSTAATTLVKARLPANTEGKDYRTELVSWAYWIGVGGEAEKQYQEANRVAQLGKTAAGAAVKIGLLSTGYGALAALALEGVSFFAAGTGKGDNVKFRILGNGTELDQGNSTTAYARQDRFRQGEISIELANDNIIDALDVQVRIVAVTVTKRFREETFMEEKEVPVFESSVTVRRVPVVSRRNR